MSYDRINVRGVIRDGEKVFLVKHKEEYDYRVFPGGGMEPGEDAKQALQREIKEELGISDVTIGDCVFIQEFYAPGRDLNILELFFEVDVNYTLHNDSHHGSSHETEIYQSKRMYFSEDTILPNALITKFQNNDSGIFYSEGLRDSTQDK